MADNRYQVGDLVPLEATFRNTAGVATNPTGVTLTVRAPDGTVTTPTPTNPSTGVYHFDLAASQAGLYWYTFKGTGTVTAADRNSFYVEEDWITTGGPLSARALIGLDEARMYVLGDVLDDTQDRKLIDRINAYSEAVWQYTRREWKPTTALTRTFRYRGKGTMSLAPYEIRTATAVLLFPEFPTADQVTLTAGTTLVTGDYLLRPSGGTPEATYRWVTFNNWNVFVRPWGFAGYGYDVKITGDWGITTVPDDVKLAVKIAVADSVKNPEGGAFRTFGDFTISEPVETTDEGQRWRALPQESRALLAPYLDDAGLIVA